ncbi:MAG: hypothetical protein LUF77_03365, partial [Oscillospiraceae bacterium]|nr:hypothetical protein [Oscillospiraceae bacterium]
YSTKLSIAVLRAKVNEFFVNFVKSFYERAGRERLFLRQRRINRRELPAFPARGIPTHLGNKGTGQGFASAKAKRTRSCTWWSAGTDKNSPLFPEACEVK